MYCLRCGFKNDDNAKYCQNCNDNIQESQNRYYYNEDRNSHHDQTLYSYKYSNDGKLPERKQNSCEDQLNYRYNYSNATPQKNNNCDDQLDYRYRYSFGKNPPKTNTNTSENQYNYSERYSNVNTNNEIIAGDEKYFQAYIGTDYNYIVKSKFSFKTLIFGPFYFLNRRMYLYGLLWIFILIAITYYNENAASAFYWFGNMFMATKFTKIYLGFVDKQIEKIKMQSLDLTSAEIIEKCRRKGSNKKQKNTEVNKTFWILMIIFGIMFITMTYQSLKEQGYFETNGYQDPIDEQIDKYIEKDISYQIPQEFINTYNTSNNKTYVYETPTNYCAIDISKHNNVSMYNTPIDYLTNIIIIEPYPEIQSELINDTVWYTVKHQNYVYYAILLKNKGYIITTTNHRDDNGYCDTLLRQFKSSLKVTYF